MARCYQNSWEAKKNIVNFNQKQWRQDLAYFVSLKKQWNDVHVSRTKLVDNGKKFEIFDYHNNSITIIYQDKNKIKSDSSYDLIREYLSAKGMM